MKLLLLALSLVSKGKEKPCKSAWNFSTCNHPLISCCTLCTSIGGGGEKAFALIPLSLFLCLYIRYPSKGNHDCIVCVTAGECQCPAILFTHFFLAGTVSYNLTGWLEKNKDPLNDSVVDQMKNGTNKYAIFHLSIII